MSRLRLCLASLLFASAVSAGCTSTAQLAPKPVPGVPQTQIDRAAVRAKLAARRQQSYERFLAYRDAMVYPINALPGGGFRHVWVDDLGNLCAAATLISGDWGRDASAAIGLENLEIKIADVRSGPINDWLLMSGLTHHEVVAIQVPGWNGQGGGEIFIDDGRSQEITRLYQIYVDVERQLTSMWDESLEDATDALMRRPDLARELLRDRVAGPGRFAQPVG
jgi:hypothetical protein